MSKVAEKAARAERLRRDEGFQEFMADVRDAQVSVFLSVSSTEEQRSEAHAIVRALSQIDGRLEAAASDQKFEQKRNGTAP